MNGRNTRYYIYRRIVQAAVLAVLVIVPMLSANQQAFSPSRVVQGMLPPPSVIDVSGDTWSFGAWGINLAHPLAFIDAVVSSKVIFIPMAIAVIVPLAVTVLFGRVFCSWMCPVGLALEFNARMRSALISGGVLREARIRDYSYVLLGAGLFLVLFLEFPVFSVFDPPHVLGREFMNAFTHGGLSMAGAGFLAGIVIFDLVFVRRGWCSRLCPSGAALGIIGSQRPLRINLDPSKCVRCSACDSECPYGLGPMGLGYGSDFDWTKCDNCGICGDACPEGAIKIGIRRK